MQLSEEADRAPDGIVCTQRRGRSGGHVPATSLLDLEAEQIVVAATEQRRPQRDHQREGVAGIVDRPQRRQEVAHLAAAVDERARLRPVRHPGRAERLLQVAERRARRQQDAHVAEPRRAPLAELLVVHRPLLGDRGACDRGDVGRFADAQLSRGDALLGVRLDSEQHYPAIILGRHAPRRVEGAVLGLGVDEWLDELAEHVIDPREHLRCRPEVAGEKARGRFGEAFARGEERRDVGAPEPVDRLLGVAHEEQSPGVDGHVGPRPVAVGRIARPEQRGQLDLDRIGVLELVDEDTAVPVAEVCARPRAVFRVAQQRACEHEQIVEIELTGGAPLGDGMFGTARDRGNQALDRAVEHRVGHRLALFSQLGDAFAQAGDVSPVLLVPGRADLERRLVGA